MKQIAIEYQSDKKNSPINVVDYSYPIFQEIFEEVSNLNDIVGEYEVIDEIYNPFQKRNLFRIKRNMVIGFKVLFTTFDYAKAVRFKKQYK